MDRSLVKLAPWLPLRHLVWMPLSRHVAFNPVFIIMSSTYHNISQFFIISLLALFSHFPFHSLFAITPLPSHDFAIAYYVLTFISQFIIVFSPNYYITFHHDILTFHFLAVSFFRYFSLFSRLTIISLFACGVSESCFL